MLVEVKEFLHKFYPLAWRWTVVWLGFLELTSIIFQRVTGSSGETWSEFTRRYVRFDHIAGPIFLVLGSWLAWHWWLRPKDNTSIGWQDAVFALLGVAWAIWEFWIKK